MLRTAPWQAGSVAALAAALLMHASASPAQPPPSVETQAGSIRVEALAEGLVHPWGIAFLPDGRALITERPGRLRILATDNTLSEPLAGVPEVFAQRQGGLLDVALDPDFASNRQVYLSFAEPGDGGASTALGRGRLGDGRIEDFQVIFRQQPKVGGGNHFGGRIVFTGQGTLFLTLAERFKFDPAQDTGNHLGTIVRLTHDGAPAPGNPFLGDDRARDEIWSYGHRNIESAALHPETGQLWIAEMGPRGGDELNLPEPGGNYGWPVVSWGENYDGSDIPDPPSRPEFADSIRHWTPVISPSGMAFYTGEAFPDWQGSLLIGGLSSQCLVRLELDGETVTDEERIALGARIRDVEQGPQGRVYLLTDQDDGAVWRLQPAD
ncbi:PQQ-dependent sugar dehydrogenase [Halomonas sp. HP20-15]|uniref:PQQ-dependent sugar dehydrogenase n=1 Tax=Halomonas sp. HP20-15 TaxID=3085901 RepID=UPI0029822AB8|nr:PQQ-dependent sugar dehydrogenase [Halomonas sp. HP20-15]MDW5376160.1 PQQ-dependent sugar dehydrogenase [Halomonas sp. HP20-15]